MALALRRKIFLVFVVYTFLVGGLASVLLVNGQREEEAYRGILVERTPESEKHLDQVLRATRHSSLAAILLSCFLGVALALFILSSIFEPLHALEGQASPKAGKPMKPSKEPQENVFKGFEMLLEALKKPMPEPKKPSLWEVIDKSPFPPLNTAETAERKPISLEELSPDKNKVKQRPAEAKKDIKGAAVQFLADLSAGYPLSQPAPSQKPASKGPGGSARAEAPSESGRETHLSYPQTPPGPSL